MSVGGNFFGTMAVIVDVFNKLRIDWFLILDMVGSSVNSILN